MKKSTWFERAVFLSWYCGRGDCKFCYMSTQKKLIKNPRKARRSVESILAEVFLCKVYGWRIEFLSGGYDSFSKEELLELFKSIYKIYGEKVWLNIGVLGEEELKLFKPYVKGVCGAIECVNPKIHDYVCPSKPISEIEKMFKICGKLGLKKAMTIILGIGETEEDISPLKDFIIKNKIDKIVFYRLKPQKNTVFEKCEPIKSSYYVEWVRSIREEFPSMQITVGSWITHIDEIHKLLLAGGDAVTKFPSIKMFNSSFAKVIEEEAEKAGRKFEGTLTKKRKIDYNKLNDLGFSKEMIMKIKGKIKKYLNNINKRFE